MPTLNECAPAGAKLWLSFEEAAEYSGLEADYLKRLARKGMIVCSPGGPRGALVIHRESLEQYEGR